MSSKRMKRTMAVAAIGIVVLASVSCSDNATTDDCHTLVATDAGLDPVDTIRTIESDLF